MSEETIETKTEEAPKNGASTQVEVKTEAAEMKAEKKPLPWIAAGYKSREEWRVATRAKKRVAKEVKKAAKKAVSKMKAKTKVKAAAKKPAKKKAKAKKVAKVKAKVKHPREEPSDRQKKVLSVLRGPMTINQIADKAFPSKSSAIRLSWVRNQLRWLRANKYVKRAKIDGRSKYSKI